MQRLRNNRFQQPIIYQMSSAVCLGALGYGASAHHMCDYTPVITGALHSNLQSSLEAIQDRNAVRAHNFNVACMEESSGS